MMKHSSKLLVYDHDGQMDKQNTWAPLLKNQDGKHFGRNMDHADKNNINWIETLGHPGLEPETSSMK